MFKIKSKCSRCNKEIKGNDVVFVKMRYPEGQRYELEIKAYLQNEEKLICEDCFDNK